MEPACNYELKEILTLPRTRLVSFLAEKRSIFQCYEAYGNKGKLEIIMHGLSV